MVQYRFHGRFVSESRAAQLSGLRNTSKYLSSSIQERGRSVAREGFSASDRLRAAVTRELRQAEERREARARSEAARRGWETRREADRQKEREREARARSEAARRGWETRKAREAGRPAPPPAVGVEYEEPPERPLPSREYYPPEEEEEEEEEAEEEALDLEPGWDDFYDSMGDFFWDEFVADLDDEDKYGGGEQ